MLVVLQGRGEGWAWGAEWGVMFTESRCVGEQSNGFSTIFLKLIFIGVWLIYNVVLVSGVQQSDSVIHIHIATVFYLIN